MTEANHATEMATKAPRKVIQPPEKKWRWPDASQAFRIISRLASDNNFRAGMFGSVPRLGEGNDLDIMLIPFRESKPSNCIATIAQAFGGKLTVNKEFNKCIIWQLETSEGKLIHILQFGGNQTHELPRQSTTRASAPESASASAPNDLPANAVSDATGTPYPTTNSPDGNASA